MTLRHRDRNFVVKQLNAEAMEKGNETRLAYVECARGARGRFALRRLSPAR